MTLHLYNTLTRSLQVFSPLHNHRVTIYACGVTVYDYCHLGHARSYIGWDVLRRYLTFCGYQVQYVQNFTDIDDKILRRAAQEGVTMAEISDRYIAAYHQDMARLNILPAAAYPRATEVIEDIIQLIADLIDQGVAYAVEGDVYYAVEAFPAYGKLSGRSLDQMTAGASGRTHEQDTKKRHPLDFALWKALKPEEKQVYTPWPSPWGLGRPGWHIECSAMVRQAFGGTIDIHSGGMDLVFPHHENEIAQSEAATRKTLAHFWLHNGFVTVSAEKMSKSLGNFTTIRQLLDSGVDPMALRLLVLQAQYRKPLDFTPAALESAENGWKTLRQALQFAEYHPDLCPQSLKNKDGDRVEPQPERGSQHLHRFQGAMDEDINTAEALAVVFEVAKELNRSHNQLTHGGEAPHSPPELAQLWRDLVQMTTILGLEITAPSSGSHPETSTQETMEQDPDLGLSPGEIEDLIQQRAQARQAKNYSEGDRLRDLLADHGIKLIDQKDGSTRWIKVNS
ncbi:cysteine--tRNA ligase [Candidatus Synechococcus calcipolaris G9]|uniref:Cysteine--tRNA ligase n=1 Tax=Candidatus Synechococcus calcipolaris G9 TaxID=1497997 RepID=A0ABT6EYK5_9SYNE|nr:cysteine--tRNA ligase [Candidatus Synechococcus calcipolaris]MDG2990321.1 cysteine--tRNA ligase [Candidatus Synechococcus calcipolaris G9]